MGPECACGCGQNLPEGSTRQYKRGHKDNPVAPVSTIDDLRFDEGESVDFSELAGSVEDDPPPRDTEDQQPKYEAPIRITKTVRKDVEGKLTWMLIMVSTMWQLTDPVCGGVMAENAANIAAKSTPILCQSPDVVKWFRKSSGFALYIDLMIAVMPLLQAIYIHHMGKSDAASMNGQGDPQAPDYATYTV